MPLVGANDYLLFLFDFYSTSPSLPGFTSSATPTFDGDKEARVRLEGSLSGLGIAVLGIW